MLFMLIFLNTSSQVTICCSINRTQRYTTYRENIFKPSQGVRAILGVEAEMALRGTFKRVRICPGKGVNMPRTSLTTNGHD